jgi:hypothetical protein
MAQPSLKITEAFRGADEEHAGDAKLRGNSDSSRSSFDLLRRAGGVPGTRAQRGGADELAEARQRPAVLPEAGAALPPEGSAGLPRMPPGIRGINIGPGPLQTGNLSARTASEPGLRPGPVVIPEPWIDSKRRREASAQFAKYAAILLMCTGLAIVALVVMYSFDAPRQFRNFIPTIPSSIEAFLREKPRLLVEAQNGLANEPLPLGATVEHASGGEIVTIEGLPEGADLSLGRRSADIGWNVPVADLEQTYVGAPTNFVGAIETTATLRSANGKLLDRQALYFEWRARNDKASDQPPRESIYHETASPGAAAATPSASSSPRPSVLALPPLASPPTSPPDTVGRASGSEAVAPKRSARPKAVHAKRPSPVQPADPHPTMNFFSPFSWDHFMNAGPARVQTQPSGKPPVRRTEERWVTGRPQ